MLTKKEIKTFDFVEQKLYCENIYPFYWWQSNDGFLHAGVLLLQARIDGYPVGLPNPYKLKLKGYLHYWLDAQGLNLVEQSRKYYHETIERVVFLEDLISVIEKLQRLGINPLARQTNHTRNITND